MSGGDKKFNIWIAYSDLFTNLSTFLFISALGAFAAIGSGVLVPHKGRNPSTPCNVPAKMAETLTRADGIISELPAAPEFESDCVRYYRIGAFRFRSPDDRLSGFRDDEGVPMDQSEVLSRICMPVWRFVSQSGFRDHDGRFFFRGIAATDRDWPPDVRCPRREEDAPRIRRLDIDFPRAHIELVSACKRNPEGTFPRYCRHIQPCFNPRRRTQLCQEVRAVMDWDDRSRLACQQQAARQQAYKLYGICERAPSDLDFQNDDLNGPEMVEEARHEDRRGALWERVDYGTYIRRGRNELFNQAPLDSHVAGSVVLEVRYSR